VAAAAPTEARWAVCAAGFALCTWQSMRRGGVTRIE